MTADKHRQERLQIMVTLEELEALDDFRFKQRMPSRAAAVRELFRLGLASAGRPSASFGIRAKRKKEDNDSGAEA